MSLQGDRLKDEGTRLQTTAAGATAGLIARYVHPLSKPIHYPYALKPQANAPISG